MPLHETQEAKLRALWFDRRLTQAQIAKRLGCSPGQIWHLQQRYKLPPRVCEKYDVALLRRLWLQTTMTPQQIAFELGSSRQFVTDWAADMGLPPRVRRGRHVQKAPTPDEIAERAAQCRARPMQDKRAEPFIETDRTGRIRCFSYCGEHYTGASLLS